MLVSVISGRGERSEPRIYPHGEAGAKGRASLRRVATRKVPRDATVCVRREVSGESRDRRERLPPDTEQGRKGAWRGTWSRANRRGERARWRQPIENEAGERSAPPPLEAKSAPTQAPKGGNPAIGAPFGAAGFPTRREVGGGLVAACFIWSACLGNNQTHTQGASQPASVASGLSSAQPPAQTQGASKPASVASGLSSTVQIKKPPLIWDGHFVGCNS